MREEKGCQIEKEKINKELMTNGDVVFFLRSFL